MHVPPHKTIHASPKCTNQSLEAPLLIVLKCCVLLDISVRTSFFLSRLPSFIPHPPSTILFLKPLSQAQTREQAAGTGTAEKSFPHARPTSASSNPLATLPIGGIMRPPAAHGFRTTSSPLQARGALGSEGAREFPGASR